MRSKVVRYSNVREGQLIYRRTSKYGLQHLALVLSFTEDMIKVLYVDEHECSPYYVAYNSDCKITRWLSLGEKA